MYLVKPRHLRHVKNITKNTVLPMSRILMLPDKNIQTWPKAEKSGALRGMQRPGPPFLGTPVFFFFLNLAKLGLLNARGRFVAATRLHAACRFRILEVVSWMDECQNPPAQGAPVLNGS